MKTFINYITILPPPAICSRSTGICIACLNLLLAEVDNVAVEIPNFIFPCATGSPNVYMETQPQNTLMMSVQCFPIRPLISQGCKHLQAG